MTIFRKTTPFTKPALLIISFICLVYSQTLNSPWQMDDYDNIAQNPKIHMKEFNWASIRDSFYATPSFENILYRPVSNFSFALNWFFGQDNVTGYHLVNIAIHVITALILYLTLVQLLQTPNAGKWDKDKLYFIALLSAILWAIHPIQIQAVTYIVQRMAALAALFYIMGIFWFLKARMARSLSLRILFTGLCSLSFLLALGSKNNSILLPVFLFLIEFIFFQDLSKNSVRKKASIIIITTMIMVSIIGVSLFFENGFNQILESYKAKPFSMGQRLLTQPSILVLYLSQIVYPTANRFSIVHDVTYATSLFQPWYTLFSITIVFLMIGLALWRIRKNPILSFAVLFYFGNQVVESTILALEMVFEHRNYLPSLFLFVPVSIAIQKMLDHYKNIQKTMYCLLIFFVCVLLSGIGFSTYIRNLDWQSTQSLWQNAAEKAPRSARPLCFLAMERYEPAGQFEKAIELYQTALLLRDDQAYYKAWLYSNMAAIYCYRLKNFNKAVYNARMALEIRSEFLHAQLILYTSLAMLGQDQDALAGLNNLLESNSSNPGLHFLKASIHMKIKEFELALTHFRQSIRFDPNNSTYLKGIGVCLTNMEYYDRGYWFINRAWILNPNNNAILLALADNRLKKGSSEEAAAHIQHLIQVSRSEHIEMILKEISQDPMSIHFDIPGLSELISIHLQGLSDSYKRKNQTLPGL